MAEEKEKILIADDMETFLRLEKMLLERSGYEILMAKTGPEAIKKIQAERPKLVFLDLVMPDMNGDAVCRFVKTNKSLKSIPVIMVTTKADRESRERCIQAGCDDYITKPVTQRDLFDKIKKFVRVERRAHSRAQLIVTVTATGKSFSFSEFTYDLSEGGIFVTTGQPIPESTVVDLEFTLPDEKEPVRSRAKVVYIVSDDQAGAKRRPGMGIQFLEISGDDIIKIRGYVTRAGQV